MFDPGVGQRHGARPGRRWFLRTQAFHGYGRLWRDFAERALYQRANILGIDVAGNHQRGVVWGIEALVEGQRILAVELFDFLAPADDRPAIRVIEIERRHHLLGQPRLRVVGDPHVEFFEHDIALRQHVLVLQDQPGHAIGLEFHHPGQLLARHALVVAGIVRRGERVLVAADPKHGLGKFTDRVLAGALEHQVLEKMRQTGFAGRLVGGADLVPDHLRDDGGAVIRDHHNLQAVAESEAGGRLRGHRGLGERAAGGDSERSEQRNEKRGGKAV